MSAIEYGPIKDTAENARAVQRLLLQDAEDSGTPNPTYAANPERSLSLLFKRLQLRRSADSFIGATVEGDFLGFMQTSSWQPSDQIPFTSGRERKELEHFNRTPFASFDPRNALHIDHLIVDSEYDEHVQAQVADRMLDLAVDKALSIGAHAVNITFHEHNPVQRMAREHGFGFTGKAGEVPTLPGVIQRLYRKPLDS